MDLRANLETVKNNIAKAAQKAGTDSEKITMIAVSKEVGISEVIELIDLGVKDFGENRIQDLMIKYAAISQKARWHLIGSLQTNKVKHVVGTVNLIHSLDRISLAQELQARAEKSQIQVSALIQVNVSEESTKHGIKSWELDSFVEDLMSYPRITIEGLMSMAPLDRNGDGKMQRICFSKLKRLYENLKDSKLSNLDLKYLSMGMSSDYDIAIQEGSNMVRIGRAIFGNRN